jgi:ElaB/YqjD/DUF883 family membrane-anchored ribosome-binding protein
MAEPVLHTPDTPNFDTYPAPIPAAERTLPPGNAGDDRLNEAAEQIGSTVGRAVRTVKQLPDQLGSLKDRFTVIQGRSRGAASEKARELKDAAGARARELKDAAGARARELKDAAGEQLQRTRRRIDEIVDEYPLQVILGAAAIAFLMGISLRVWRSNRG